MSDKKLKVAVIGLGMGVYHLECYCKNPRAEVVAVCDINKAYAQSVADKHNVPRITSDYTELLSDPSVEAVSVALPTYLHSKVSVDFLNAGKDVLVEKPMAHNLDAALSMAEAAETSGRLLMVHHNRRYDAVTQQIKRLLDSHTLGHVYFVRTGWRRAMSTMIAPTLEREGYTFDRGWFMDKRKGGGVLLDLGSHMIDRAMYLLGFPKIRNAMGIENKDVGAVQEAETGCKFDAEDFATGLVKFDNGCTLQLEVSFGSYIEQDEIYSHFYGSLAGISDRNGLLKVIEPCYGAIKVGALSNLPEPEITSPVDDFVSVLTTGRQPLISVQESLDVMRVLDVLRRSAESNGLPLMLNEMTSTRIATEPRAESLTGTSCAS